MVLSFYILGDLMSFISDEQPVVDNGLNELKPAAKNVGALDMLGKFKSDLRRLENGKMIIERTLTEKGISDNEIDKKLERINKSIETLKQMIKDFEKEYGLDTEY